MLWKEQVVVGCWFCTLGGGDCHGATRLAMTGLGDGANTDKLCLSVPPRFVADRFTWAGCPCYGKQSKGEAGSAPYVAAKAAVIGFTRSLAMELGPDAITVNCVAPAWTASDMTDEYLRTTGKLEDILRTIPLGRIGKAEEVAKAVTFLASDNAAYITGETLYLTGGAI